MRRFRGWCQVRHNSPCCRFLYRKRHFEDGQTPASPPRPIMAPQPQDCPSVTLCAMMLPATVLLNGHLFLNAHVSAHRHLLSLYITFFTLGKEKRMKRERDLLQER